MSNHPDREHAYMLGWVDGSHPKSEEPWKTSNGDDRVRANVDGLTELYMDGWAAGRHARNLAKRTAANDGII